MARKVQVCHHRKEDGEYTPIAECAQCRAWQALFSNFRVPRHKHASDATSLLATHGYDSITQGRPTDGE